jgi:hypothetical protein
MPVQTQAVTIDPSSPSGQMTLTTAGTVYQGADKKLSNGVYVKAMSSNGGTVYVGNSSVSSSTGFELSAGDIVLVQVANLADLYFVGTANGDKICYLRA